MKKLFKKIIKNIYLLQVLLLCFLFACSNKEINNSKIDNNQVIAQAESREFTFRADYLKKEHFEKHKKEFDYDNEDDYELGANRVIHSKDALIKEEKEDGDYVYYIVDTNEIVFLSKDGYIRSYFKPTKGKKYFDKQ